MNSFKFALCSFIALATSLLVPPGLRAQSPTDNVSTRLHVSALCYGCSDNQEHSYDNDQTVPLPGTVYTEDHSLSTELSNEFGHVSAAFGAAAVTLVENSYSDIIGTPPSLRFG
jgi:hypothetical protein